MQTKRASAKASMYCRSCFFSSSFRRMRQRRLLENLVEGVATVVPVLPSPPRKQWHRHHDPAALESPIPYVVVIFHHIDRKTNNHSNNIQTICDIHRHHPQHGLVVLTCSSYHVLQVNPRSHHLATKHRHICCFLHLGIVLHDDGSVALRYLGP